MPSDPLTAEITITWFAQWEAKYADQLLKPVQLEELKASKASAAAALAAEKDIMTDRSRKSEKQCGIMRLAAFNDETPVANKEVEVLGYEKMRNKVAEEVARSRMYSSRISGDLSTGSMLADISPGLWSSVNAGGYVPPGHSTANRDVHFYNKGQGWGERVDKQHFNTVNEMSSFAEAALKLGEKPFKGGKM